MGLSSFWTLHGKVVLKLRGTRWLVYRLFGWEMFDKNPEKTWHKKRAKTRRGAIHSTLSFEQVRDDSVCLHQDASGGGFAGEQTPPPTNLLCNHSAKICLKRYVYLRI